MPLMDLGIHQGHAFDFNKMGSLINDSITAYKQHILVSIATLEQHLCSPFPDATNSRAIEEGIICLNTAYKTLHTRGTELLACSSYQARKRWFMADKAQ